MFAQKKKIFERSLTFQRVTRGPPLRNLISQCAVFTPHEHFVSELSCRQKESFLTAVSVSTAKRVFSGAVIGGSIVFPEQQHGNSRLERARFGVERRHGRVQRADLQWPSPAIMWTVACTATRRYTQAAARAALCLGLARRLECRQFRLCHGNFPLARNNATLPTSTTAATDRQPDFF